MSRRLAVVALHSNKVGYGLAAAALLRHALTTGARLGLSGGEFSRVMDGSREQVASTELTLEVERGLVGGESRCGPQ